MDQPWWKMDTKLSVGSLHDRFALTDRNGDRDTQWPGAALRKPGPSHRCDLTQAAGLKRPTESPPGEAGELTVLEHNLPGKEDRAGTDDDGRGSVTQDLSQQPCQADRLNTGESHALKQRGCIWTQKKERTKNSESWMAESVSCGLFRGKGRKQYVNPEQGGFRNEPVPYLVL